MALSGTGSGTNYVWRAFGPFTRAGVSPWSRTNGMQITLSGWVRLRASPSGQQALFGIGNYADSTRFHIYVDTNFVFAASYVNGSAGATAAALSPTNSATTGQWVHVLGTINCTSNPQATLFINNASYTATSGADSSTTAFNNFTLLRRPSSTTQPAATTTDVAEVAVYAGLLSAGDAEALRCGQNPVSVEGHRLLAYFPLRDNVQDRSPYAIGLTQAASYTLAWSDHPPVQQPPLNRILRASFPDLTATIAGEIPITAEIAANLSPFVVDGGDTHDGLRRSRRERRLEALRRRADAEKLADAQALRLSLEAALGLAAEVAPAVAPRVAEAVERAPKPSDVDWRRVAEDAEQYARLSRAVAKLSALVQAEARRLADEDDDDAAFLLGIV